MSDGRPNHVLTRSMAFAALSVGLAAGSIPLHQLAWTADAWIHTVFETIATVLAFAVGAIALVRYYTWKSLSYLLLGTAFLGAGLLDGFHDVVTSPLCPHSSPSSLEDLVAWSGFIPRMFLSLLMCGRLFASNTEQHHERENRIKEGRVYWGVGACFLVVFLVFLLFPLPPPYHPESSIHRPADLVTGFLFAIATLGYLRKGAWKTGGFESFLVLFLTTASVDHLFYTPFSGQYFDAASCMADCLKVLAYLFVVVGLLRSMSEIFRGANQSLADQKRANESLAAEIAHRLQVEKALHQARQKLEERVATNTIELAKQDTLAALTSRIALVLTRHEPIRETLQQSAAIIAEALNAAFVRIWTLNTERDMLELQASAGMYTHLDGPHGRVPVGHLKIGRIAQDGKPHLTNAVLEDSWVGDPEWARREGMVAFAGYPLMVEGRVEGVIAAFARGPLEETALQSLGSIAGALAPFIGQRQGEAGLQDSEERVRLLLDSTNAAICGCDDQGACIFANRAALNLLGYEKTDDLFGQNMHQLMHHTRSDGRPFPASECMMSFAFVNGETRHAEDEVFWRADGTSFPAEYWCYPVMKAGKPVGAVVPFFDISVRKQAEEEQRKLASLVEASADFIAISSPGQKIVYLNGAGAKMIGLESPRQAIGHNIVELHPASAWTQLESGIHTLLATGELREESQLLNWKTGESIDVLLSAFLLRKPETGEVLCFAAIMRDIT